MERKNRFLSYAEPLIGRGEISEILDTLASGWLSRGPKCTEFEKRFAQLVGSRYAVGVNSCTAAMFLALKAMGIGPGDEVITTPLTFVATANVIIHTGAQPVFADINPKTFNLDPAEIEKKISPRTRAVLPVHYAGRSCDMDRIMDIANANGLKVLEDAAHAVGTQYKGRTIGSIGDATAFSFYVTKNIMTGEGGMVTTDDEELACKVRMLSQHGMDLDAWKRYSAAGSWYYQVMHPGYKCNMTDLQASLGLSQLKRLEVMQGLRELYAQVYHDGLKGLPGITLPEPDESGVHAWHLYVIRVDEAAAGISRERFIEELKQRGIGTSVHFIPVHLHSYYRTAYGYQDGDYPAAEQVFRQIVSLPLYPKMSLLDVERVIEAVKEIIKNSREVVYGRQL